MMNNKEITGDHKWSLRAGSSQGHVPASLPTHVQLPTGGHSGCAYPRLILLVHVTSDEYEQKAQVEALRGNLYQMHT